MADYDPGATFTQSSVDRYLAYAEIAIAAFGRIPVDEQADILALMFSNPRP